MSFATVFMSTGDDSGNTHRAAKVGRELQINLHGQSVVSTMDVKSKGQALSSLIVNEKKIHIDLLLAFSTHSHYPC